MTDDTLEGRYAELRDAGYDRMGAAMALRLTGTAEARCEQHYKGLPRKRTPDSRGLNASACKSAPATVAVPSLVWEEEGNARHVDACRAHGWFPRAARINGGTVWVYPDEARP